MRTGALALALVAGTLAPSCDDRGEPANLTFTVPEGDFWKDTRPPLAPGNRILVTNNLSDTVSVLDLDAVGSATVPEVARVPVGLIPVEREGPHHVTADAAGEFYYLGISNFVPGAGSGPHGNHGTGTADGHVIKMRVADQLPVATLRVDRNPGDIRLTPDGQRLLVTHFDVLKIHDAFHAELPSSAMDARLAIIDPVAMTRLAMVTVCPAPHGVAISPDSRTVYVSCYSDEIAIVDLTAPDRPVRRLPVRPDPGEPISPRCSPYAMTISPAGDSVWVSCLIDGALLRYDVAGGAMDAGARVILPGGALFGSFSADGATLVMPHQSADGVAFIDVATHTVLADKTFTPAECIAPHVVHHSDDQRHIMMVCEGDHATPGTFVVLDAATREVRSVTPLGVFPDDIAISRVPR